MNLRILYQILCVVATLSLYCPPARAHPGHDLLASLPSWRLSDGRTISGYILKFEDDRIWLVDESGQTQVLAMNDFDQAAKAEIRRFNSRMKIINRQAGCDAAMPPAAAPKAAEPFSLCKGVKTRWDDQFLYVESNGIPDHPMMIGITNWQQQVPLPQSYFGDNAWQIPLNPQVATTPAMIKGRFLRGAIALAVNGIPIFNPQNNRGEISQEIGELDKWGGHCGRADDYHYHIVPLHLQKIVGKNMPLAYALDGYPIYGETEPDGSPVGKLDECNGHTTAIGYHYHASTKYPYVIAGFHGVVVERDGQVDPQPRATPVRPALSPLRGASITDFKMGQDRNDLIYEVNGRKGSVSYAPVGNGSYQFTFVSTDGQKDEQTYSLGKGRGGRDDARPRPTSQAAKADKRVDAPDTAPRAGTFQLRSSEVADGGAIPVEYTGDGASATLPLEWSGAPAGTRSFALVMHHIPGPGDVKWYWIIYNIPADVHSLAKNAKGVGTLGNNSVNRRLEYAPPHSKGPGLKTYILTLYALSDQPKLTVAPERVDRATLLTAIKDITLASAELKFTYDRTAIIQGGGGDPQPEPRSRPDDPSGGESAPYHLMRREVEDLLNLSPEQRKQLQALEQETKQKLDKILTPEQRTLLTTRPPGDNPPPPPPEREK